MVLIYNFVYTVSLVADAPFIDTVQIGTVVFCCKIYVHHSPRDGRFTVIAINPTAWGHAIREGPEKSDLFQSLHQA